MKQIVCVLLLIFICTSNSFGQGAGIYYTKNGAKLTGDKPQNFKIAYDQGFAFGGFIDLKVAKDVTLSVQPGYQKIQSKIRIPDLDDPDGGLKDTLDFRIDFFSLPILFKIQPMKNDRLYFIGGPAIGFVLDSNTSNEQGEETDRSDIIKELNVSLNFGLGYKIPIKSTFAFIEVRYEQGLVNITDFGEPEELFSRTKTQGINLSIGFGIPFKRKSVEEQD